MSNQTKVSRKGFDRITGIYDVMACFFSFDRINKSQLAFLSPLSTQKTALILGGGTGYFLQQLLKQNTSIQVTYVDVSPKMIAYSRKRIQKNRPQDIERVSFICAAVEDLDWQSYDLIVCNYILDLFDNATVEKLAKKFKHNLNPEGFLYVTDFQIPENNKFLKWSTTLGLKILYKFFGYTTQLHTKQLPEIDRLLKEQGFSISESKSFLCGILMCQLYTIED